MRLSTGDLITWSRRTAKALLEELGLTSGGVYTPPSGGGGTPTGYDTTVAAGENLATALAAGGTIYVSGTPADVASTIVMSADAYVECAPGLTWNFASGVTTLINPAGFKLTVRCNGLTIHTKATTGTVTIAAGASGSRVDLEGELSLTSLGGAVYSGCAGAFGDVLLPSNVHYRFYDANGEGLDVKSIFLDGAGSAASVQVNSGVHVGLVHMQGTLLTVTSLFLPETYAGVMVYGTVDLVTASGNVSRLLGIGGHVGSIRFLSGSGALYAALVTGGTLGASKGGLVYPVVRSDLGDARQYFGPGHYRNLHLASSATQADFSGAQFDTALTVTDGLSDSTFRGGRFFELTLNSANFIRNSFHGVFFDSTFTWTAASRLSFHGCVFEPGLTIPSGANSLIIGCHILSTLTNNDPLGTTIIGCFDSSGARIPDQIPSTARVGAFNNSALDRLNRSIVKLYNFDDAVSSPEAVAIAQGFGNPLVTESGTPTFGSTAILGTKTCVSLDSGEQLASWDRAGGPTANEDFALFCYIQTSAAAPASACGLIGWEDLTSTATGRVKLVFITTGAKLEILDGNTAIAATALPTSWAADIGDGSIHQVGFSRTDWEWVIWLDGVSFATATSAPAQDASVAPLKLQPGVTMSFAQLMHINRDVTSTEVSTLWNSGSPLEANA